MPVTAIDDIGLAPSSYTPEIGDQMTLWNLYNATTAWISYRNNSGQAMKTTEKMAARALNLLTQNPEDIILAGQKRRREYEEAIKRKIEAEEDRKRTKAQEVQAGLKARGVDAW